MYMEMFAERLKELLGNESVNSFAKKIGIPQQTLSRYMNLTILILFSFFKSITS